MLKTMNFVFRIIQDSTHEIYEVCKGQDLIVVSHSQMGATEAEALGIPIVNVTLQKEMIPEKLKPQTIKDKFLGGMIGKQMADMTILDLGAGSGYLSFPIAKENRSCKVVGLDIVSKALEVNRERADRENLSNLSFVSYDGIDFPFADASFDMVITRYALHHFPDIEHSIGEVSRVLKKNGSFFVSDPCPNDCDSSRFVDEYMQMKKDGHIKFYTKKEWEDICGKFEMKMSDFFESSIRFPRKRDTAYGFDGLLKKHEQSVIDSYDLVVTDTEIYVTERVNNILFSK